MREATHNHDALIMCRKHMVGAGCGSVGATAGDGTVGRAAQGVAGVIAEADERRQGVNGVCGNAHGGRAVNPRANKHRTYR